MEADRGDMVQAPWVVACTYGGTATQGSREARPFAASVGKTLDAGLQARDRGIPLRRDLREVALHLVEPARTQAPDALAAVALAVDEAGRVERAEVFGDRLA